MEDSFTKDRFHFGYWAKTLKNEVLKRNPQIILGFFDSDPVLLADQGAEQRIKISQQGAQDQKIPE